jgi:hypothetical protein
MSSASQSGSSPTSPPFQRSSMAAIRWPRSTCGTMRASSEEVGGGGAARNHVPRIAFSEDAGGSARRRRTDWRACARVSSVPKLDGSAFGAQRPA